MSYSIKEGLASDSVSTILASRNGGVWVGGAEALGFLKQDRLSAIRAKHGLPGRDITTMFEDHLGRLWMGVDSTLALLDRGRFQPIRKANGAAIGIVFGITEDVAGNEWVVTDSELFRIENLRVRLQTKLPQKAYSILADPKEGVWLGFENGDLARYHDNRSESFAADSKVSTARIRMLLPEPGGLWGVTRDGLIWWDGSRRTFLSSRNGLPCNELYAAVKDESGTLWLYARCGLLSLAAKQLSLWRRNMASQVKVRMLDVYDGAQPGITPLQPQASRSLDGRLWFANNNIVQTFDPKRRQVNPQPPNVVVERMTANRVSYRLQHGHNLPPLIRSLEVDFTALSFVAPSKVRFRYKLEGHDTDWQDSQGRREAFYGDLSPGQYHFRVIACNNDGVWNDAGATWDFSVAPAFYQTGWFQLLCIAAAGCVAGAIYMWRVRILTARLNLQFGERLSERTRIAQELHDTLLQGALSASMQLSVANDQLRHDAPAKALVMRVLELQQRMVVEGRNAIRGLRLSTEELQDLGQAFSRIPQEIAVRGAVDFRVAVEGSSRSLHPVIRDEVYRIGREALTNAFHHSGATNIVVALTYGRRELRMVVSDNGRGIDPAVLRMGRECHWGLKGMRERAEKIGGKLTFSSRTCGGTEVDLCVPGPHRLSITDAASRFHVAFQAIRARA